MSQPTDDTAGGTVHDDAPPPTIDLDYETAHPAPPDEDEQSPLAVARFRAIPAAARHPDRVYGAAGSAAYRNWVARGRPFTLAYPCADLMATLRRYGYVVYAYPDSSHLLASTPEDHTPFSATGWPGTSPFGWGLAVDIMPPTAGSPLPSLARLGAQMIADKVGGVPGMAWLKYANWTPAGGQCTHDSFEPGRVTRPSSDAGHIHLSARTDFYLSRCAAGYDPVARVRGGVTPPVVHPVENGAPAWPGRVLVAQSGSAMMHGTDVQIWQAQMAHRGWTIKADGWYGEISAGICRQFQQDSTAHGWPLDADSEVGPKTWDATWNRPVS